MRSFRHNEGGRGLVAVWLERRFLYVCFWTPWIAPRLAWHIGQRPQISFST